MEQSRKMGMLGASGRLWMLSAGLIVAALALVAVWRTANLHAGSIPAGGGIVAADPDDPLLTLVNPDHYVPEDWTMELVEVRRGQYVDSRAYGDLMAMLEAAGAEGLHPLVCSSYRTQEKQTQLYENKLKRCLQSGMSQEEAEREAAFWVAIPGTSEHQLGLAVDIVSKENQNLNESQEDTPTQQWLMAHCWEYGFILRYRKDKTDVTRIGYEPWHYRYVGRAAAQEIRQLDVCLEEYLAALP
ncbi:MAG: M15 family metallopeptidase [Clostridia bacterium]|nr:M15 family metallopeptidase [Clostridia bacterium]